VTATRSRFHALRHLRNPFWAMLEYGWYPLLLFASTPWFLHRLGTQQYGHWMLLSATVNFGGILNAGTGAATIKSVSAGLGRMHQSMVTETTRRSLALALLGGGILALLVLAIFWFGGNAFLDRMGDQSLVRTTGVAAAALLWVEQLDNVFSSSLKGAEHFGLAARIEMTSKTVQILAAALILIPIPNLRGLYTALLVVALFRLTAKAITTKLTLHLTSLRPTLSGVSEIFHFAKWGWLQGIGGTLFSVADRMLVGSLLGANSLTYYSIASQLTMQIHATAAAGLSVIFPRVSRQLEGNAPFSLRRIASLAMAANFLMSSVLAGILIVFGHRLLNLWIGESSATHVLVVLPWLTIAYWLLAINVVPYYLLLGMGKMRFIGLTVLLAGILAVLSMYYATLHYGLAGTPVGRGIYALVSLALLVPLAKSLRKEQHTARQDEPSLPTKSSRS
jgi:O-antigen/teichoic acid export membrane protein